MCVRASGFVCRLDLEAVFYICSNNISLVGKEISVFLLVTLYRKFLSYTKDLLLWHGLLRPIDIDIYFLQYRKLISLLLRDV